MNTFGQKLRKAREDSGLTQAELAQKVGAYQSKYRNWESDINEPDFATFNKLCDVLGVSADWLLGRDQKPQPYPSEYEKEVHLFREEARPYGAERVKKLRKILPMIFDKPTKKESK